MTVKELIAHLQTFDENRKVEIAYFDAYLHGAWGGGGYNHKDIAVGTSDKSEQIKDIVFIVSEDDRGLLVEYQKEFEET